MINKEEIDRMTEARKTRLKRWIDTEFDGCVAAFTRYYGMSKSTASYISQLFAGLRGFGEKSARSMELQAGKPHGWLDMEDEAARRIEQLVEIPVFRYDYSQAARLPQRYKDSVSDYISFVIAKAAAEQRTKQADSERVELLSPVKKRTLEIEKMKYNSISERQHPTKRAVTHPVTTLNRGSHSNEQKQVRKKTSAG